MAKVSEDRESQEEASVKQIVEEYVKTLGNEHKMLVVLKSQLYGGKWDPMLDDLQNRLQGKPYIFKLANRIKDDVDRIREMIAFEAEHHVDLGDFVELS